MRIDALLARGASEAIAIEAGAISWSYARLAAEAAGWAERLAGEAVAPGARVALWAPKSPAFVAALLGIWRAGAVAVPINPLLKPAQVVHILTDSGAVRLLTTPERGALLPPGEAVPLALAEGLAGSGAAVPRGPQELAAILYTSGSTGRPKGVMLSHANLWLAADSVAKYQRLDPEDRALALLPLSFDAGLSVLTSALMAGGCAVLLDYLAPRDVVRAIERHAITTLAGVPPLFAQLEAVPWPAATPLRRLTVTGGRMPVALTRAWRARYPAVEIYLMYGLTEAFRSLYLPPALVDAHPESVGGPIPHAELFVLRPDGSPCAEGEPGELVHVGPLVAQGYWADAARTAERFRPAPPFARSGRTGVWSGDTLVVRGGLFYFVGRDDEMIKVSGMRLSPTEIEEAAMGTGALAECVALGVADAALGARVALVAAPAAGLSPAAAAALLEAGLKQALPAYMRPERTIWLESLPRNANAKLDRAALRAAYAQ